MEHAPGRGRERTSPRPGGAILDIACNAGWLDPREEAKNSAWVRAFYRELFADIGGGGRPSIRERIKDRRGDRIMKLLFTMGTRKVLVSSMRMQHLHGGVLLMSRRIARRMLNRMTEEAVERFLVEMGGPLGIHKVTNLTTVPKLDADSPDSVMREILNLYIGGAHLQSRPLSAESLASGSHSIVVWTQSVSDPVSFPGVLAGRTWESIADDYDD